MDLLIPVTCTSKIMIPEYLMYVDLIIVSPMISFSFISWYNTSYRILQINYR